MPTYAELAAEPVWGEQITPPNMLALLVEPLRVFYQMGPTLIGAPGDNRHLRGRHRSRDWDLTSIYCTNRTYSTTDARDRDGDGAWYRAVDIGITGATLQAACRRLDALVRSGGDGGRVAEWFGTVNGIDVVGWFEGHASSSDTSHLKHLHVGAWTRYANDPELMTLLYQTIIGEDASMLCKYADKGKVVEALQRLLLKLDPKCLPRFGPDGGYGDETATAMVNLHLVTGGDQTGRTYGPIEYANVAEAIARKFAVTPSGVPVHEHTWPAGHTDGITTPSLEDQ